jgi:hypothetical protein
MIKSFFIAYVICSSCTGCDWGKNAKNILSHSPFDTELECLDYAAKSAYWVYDNRGIPSQAVQFGCDEVKITQDKGTGK